MINLVLCSVLCIVWLISLDIPVYVNWFSRYLPKRQYPFCISGIFSFLCVLNSGISQRTISGPVFLMYLLMLYVTVFIILSNSYIKNVIVYKLLQSDTDSMRNWCLDHNFGKSMIISFTFKMISINFNYKRWNNLI